MHAELTESSEEARSFRIRINVFGENLRHTMSFGRKHAFDGVAHLRRIFQTDRVVLVKESLARLQPQHVVNCI